ncbi:MAG TPA: SMC-Scp complex subunit ScpB [archaeon]|nr:SMC-Scp complex subunit ScpB [archaeon]
MTEVSMLEAALFLSGKPVALTSLAEMLGLQDVKKVEEGLNELVRQYSSRESGLEVVRLGDKFKIQIKKEYSEKLKLQGFGTVATDLSKAELKTLAFIVYKQPVKQSTIVRNRGSGAYEHVHKLRDLNFVKAARERNTFILSPGPAFQDYFGEDAITLKKKVLPNPLQPPAPPLQPELVQAPQASLTSVGKILEEELEEVAVEEKSSAPEGGATQ